MTRVVVMEGVYCTDKGGVEGADCTNKGGWRGQTVLTRVMMEGADCTDKGDDGGGRLY